MIKALIAIALIACCAHGARGQCSNGPCYTANPPAVTRLTLAQYAAQGDGHTNATATINIDGSHNETVGVGTVITYKTSSNNGSSAQMYGIDSYGKKTGPWNTSLSSTWTSTTQATDVGNPTTYYFVVTNSFGVTQDRATIAVVNGPPGIVSADKVPEGKILHFHASGGGGSMLSDFTICQGADQQHCINATHTPQTWLTVTNLNTGFSLSHAKHISGNVAKANESVSFGDDIFLPALPEDIFDYNEGDEVDCSVSGPVGVGPVQMDIRFERAITEEYISSILNSNGMHPEHIYCIIAATPPDFPGADEALPGTPSGQIVNIAFLYREWPKGTQEKGTPWNLVFPDIQEVGIGYYVKTTMEPDPVGCTMWDNGFRHLPLPTPLDPQPQ